MALPKRKGRPIGKYTKDRSGRMDRQLRKGATGGANIDK